MKTPPNKTVLNKMIEFEEQIKQKNFNIKMNICLTTYNNILINRNEDLLMENNNNNPIILKN